jgi:large subunit ribosomal protein L29
MKMTELRGKNEVDLAKLERGIREELFMLQFRQRAGQVQNPTRIGKLKRDVARIHTLRRAIVLRRESV